MNSSVSSLLTPVTRTAGGLALLALRRFPTVIFLRELLLDAAGNSSLCVILRTLLPAPALMPPPRFGPSFCLEASLLSEVLEAFETANTPLLAVSVGFWNGLSELNDMGKEPEWTDTNINSSSLIGEQNIKLYAGSFVLSIAMTIHDVHDLLSFVYRVSKMRITNDITNSQFAPLTHTSKAPLIETRKTNGWSDQITTWLARVPRDAKKSTENASASPDLEKDGEFIQPSILLDQILDVMSPTLSPVRHIMLPPPPPGTDSPLAAHGYHLGAEIGSGSFSKICVASHVPTRSKVRICLIRLL